MKTSILVLALLTSTAAFANDGQRTAASFGGARFASSVRYRDGGGHVAAQMPGAKLKMSVSLTKAAVPHLGDAAVITLPVTIHHVGTNGAPTQTETHIIARRSSGTVYSGQLDHLGKDATHITLHPERATAHP